MTDLDQFTEAYSAEFPYDLDNRLILSWYPQRILNRVEGNSLLELGVGHGYTTALFSRRFSRHVVLDGSPQVIARFKERFPDCDSVLVCDYFENYESEERFDVIVMGFVLEHVEAPGLVLRSFKRFLRSGGKVFVVVPNAEALNKRVGQAAGLLDDLHRLSDADLALGHRRLFTVDTLSTLVREEGYSIEHLEGIFLKPISTRQMHQLELSDAVLKGFLEAGIDYPELCVGILMELKI